jgi:hypothetical protein
MGFRVWGSAKNIILKGLEDVCLVIVSDAGSGEDRYFCVLGWARPFEAPFVPPVAFAQGKQGKEGKEAVLLRVLFFLVNNNVPYPWFSVSVADKGVKPEGQTPESKNASKDAGATGYGTEYYLTNTIRWETLFVKGKGLKIGDRWV